MGASGWSYRTPYQPDTEAALRQLRAEVFARGEYEKPWEMIGISYAEMRAGAEDNFDDPEEAEAILRPFGTSPPADDEDGPDGPATIEELLAVNAESGTHSILDILAVGAEPDFGTAGPVPDEVLTASFGTTRPTAEQVGPGYPSYPKPLARLIEDLERWQAVYFVIYKDGAPHQIAFEGNSGD
jgi:hypothetical protein